MNPQFKRVKDIFLAALEKEGTADREAYLSAACASDPALRGQVDALLRRHEQAGSFLQFPSPASSPPSSHESKEHQGEGSRAGGLATIDVPITERPGTVIGPYKLMEQIGEGGMGLVFVAEQQYPIRRKVALKVIKPGMDTRAVVARFEAERQALALMDHPNIARVHDGGQTSTGRPYFVMELVKGVPITLYCDQSRLTNRERLELFIHVCDAVQHAHQKGIIHRDIKPTNVLVVSHDGTPVVKVIDFGVAKSIGQQLTDKTIYTQFVQLVGTPLYMSPEQAGESGLDVDTRSDIYSLGVLLYELLTGTTPFNKERLKEASYEEIRRIIREEEPPKPSTRISTLVGQVASTVSTQRRSDPGKLRQMVRGELDWIVMKAMEKDRTRRYQTASGLAADVQRYLHDEPVQACPPSAAYRLRKFARKYRTLLRAAAAIVVLLVLAAALSIWQAVLATQAARRATQAEERALDEQKQALKEKDRAEASFHMARNAVDHLFTRVSQSPKLKAKPMEKFRRDLLQRAKEFYERFVKEQSDAPGVRHDLGLAYLRLAGIDRELGEYSEAENWGQKAVSILDELIRAQPGVEEYERDLATAYSALGRFYFVRSRTEKSLDAYQKAQAIQEKHASADPGGVANLYALAKTDSDLGLVHNHSEHPELAAKVAKQGQDILGKLEKDPKNSEYQSVLAATQLNLGQVYHTLGARQQEEAAFKAAASIYEKMIRSQPDPSAEYSQSLAQSYALLGICYQYQNKFKEAEVVQKDALKIFEGLAKEHPDVPEFAYDVGRCYWALAETADRARRAPDAIALYDKSIRIMEDALHKGYDHARSPILDVRIARNGVLARQGEHVRAAEEVEAIARQGDLQSVNLYNIACFFSRSSAAVDRDTKLSAAEHDHLKARYADRAMEFLRQAVTKGWRVPTAIKNDPDLEPLQSRKDFQELIAELEAKGKDSEKRSQESGDRNRE